MDTELRYPLTELATDSLMRLQDSRGCVVAVFEGQVWITQAADLRDVVLDAGESFRVDRNGLTLLMALKRSKIMLLQPGDRLPAKPELSSFELMRQARQQRAEMVSAAVAQVAKQAWTAVRGALTPGWLLTPRPTAARATLTACNA